MKMHFLILLKKNMILEWRLRWQFLIELGILVVCYTIVVIRPFNFIEQSYLTSSTKSTTIVFDPETVDNLNIFMSLVHLKRRPIRMKLAFAPDIPYARTIVENVAKRLDLRGVVGYDTREQLIARIDTRTTLAGISMPELGQDDEDLPSALAVQLHFPTNLRTLKASNVVEQSWLTRCLGVPTAAELDLQDFAEREIYVREGFLHLQNLVFLEWYAMLRERHKITTPMPEIRTRTYRSGEPNWINCSLTGDSNLAGHLCFLSFMLPFLNLIWKYGRERELNLLAHHWRYGCVHVIYWLAHFIVSLVHFALLDLVVIIILKVPWTSDRYSGIIFNKCLSYMIIYFFLHSVGLILSAIAVVSIFNNAKTALLIGITIWLNFYIILIVALENVAKDSKQPYILFSFVIFFNNSWPFAYVYFRSISFLNPHVQDWILFGTQLGNIFYMLIMIIIVLYFAPGKYLRQTTFNFMGICTCCQRQMMKQRLMTRNQRPTIVLLEPIPSAGNYEFVPNTAIVAMTVSNVCTQNQHLNSISLRLIKGEITVILGHCGSGKSTLVSVMAGWQEPSTGWVLIDGVDIYEEWYKLRSTIEVLMPTNILFDLLTIREVLMYFIRIKMTKSNTATWSKELNKWLKLLRPMINQKLDKILVKSLTFGQQRLVSLCCVLAGDATIVLLDEPTLHMSGEEMRNFWKLLEVEKAHRAIMITTISIYEAEAVGDRIGILGNGILHAFGTLFFLKVKYGEGFKLILLTNPDAVVQRITTILQKYIPGIQVHNVIGDQITYLLGHEKRPIFQRMLIALERDRESLGIVHLRVLGSELTDAYMNINNNNNNQNQQKIIKPSIQITYRDREQRPLSQFRTLIYKKFLEQMPCCIPIIVLLLTFLISLYMNGLAPSLTHTRKNNGFMLGLENVSKKDEMMPRNLVACRTVRIDSFAHNYLMERQNALSNLIFTNHSLNCDADASEIYVQNVTKLPAYGLIELTDVRGTFWFNQHVFHSAPIALNILQNLMLIKTFPALNNYSTTIDNCAINLPLWIRINLLDQVLANLRAPMLFGIVVPLIVSTFIIPLVEDHKNNMLLLQVMAGMRMKIYWTVNFIWDWLLFMLYSIILLLFLNITHIKIFGIRAQLLCFWLLVVYGMAGIAMMYLISMCRVRRPFHAFLISFVIQLMTGLCAFNIYWDVIENNSIYYRIALHFPLFAFLDAISNIYCVEYQRSVCEKHCKNSKDCKLDRICDTLPACCDDNNLRYQDPGILAQMSYMFSTFIILIFIIFFVDLVRKELKHRISKKYTQYRSAAYSYDDDDVRKLKVRLAESDLRECSKKRLYVDQLELYRTKKNEALKTISFDVDTGESVCIFGARHSGKTKLIRELVGDRGFMFGDVFIMGTELKYACSEAQYRLGYCPQANDFAAHLTPHQILRIICLLRGVPNEHIGELIQEIGLFLNLLRQINRKIAHIGAVNRRKLAVAIALIADNDVVILDEPTYGLPASARRDIWNVLRLARNSGKAVIFSTCNGTECEILADRVVVFDQGEMLAVGSAHYLRNKFTDGFYLEIQLNRDNQGEPETIKKFRRDVENLDRFISFLHNNSELRSHVGALLKFFIPVHSIIYSYLFGALEKSLRRLNIQSYTVSLGTMEDALRNISAKRLRRSVDQP